MTVASFLGTGWSFPPEFGPGGGEVAMVADVEDVHQSLQILLATRQGERAMQETYGCNLDSVLFEEIDPALVNNITGFISDAIVDHEPRVDLQLGRRVARGGTGRVADPDRLHDPRNELAIQPGLPVLPQRGNGPRRVMADYVLVDGDKAIFKPAFGAATVVVQPGTLKGSGPATVGDKPMCISGDESSVSVEGCIYTTTIHTIPGVGTLQISQLASDQVATKTSTGGTKVMLVGSAFTAAFAVQTPAQQPTSSGTVADPTPRYSSTGSFTSTNSKFKGV